MIIISRILHIDIDFNQFSYLKVQLKMYSYLHGGQHSSTKDIIQSHFQSGSEIEHGDH